MDRDDDAQRCTGCGRVTLVGTPLFSDRQTAHTEDGEPIFLCGDCNERAISHFGRRLTEVDMRQLSARAAGFGIAVHGGAGLGSAGAAERPARHDRVHLWTGRG